MTKKNLLLALFGSSLVFFAGCSKDLADPEFDVLAAPDGKGKPVVESTNNLSYPAIAVDEFSITPITTPSFTVPYTGDYPGLTAEEIAWLDANGFDDDDDVATPGKWYPQKTTGNSWQAEYVPQASENVTFIDWGDNIESVSPKIRAPFRLEMTLYKALETPMTAYTMRVLEYPSSSNELQGTNTTTYDGYYATVISGNPKLVVQYLGSSVPSDLTWVNYNWIREGGSIPTIVPVSFAPELNVGGKYIYGASQGGWKPESLGYYRITFYVPSGSGVNLALGKIANASDNFGQVPSVEESEGGVATPFLVPEHNLTYVDVLVKSGGRR